MPQTGERGRRTSAGSVREGALAELIDPAKLLAVIDNWPDSPSFEADGWVAQSAGLPRGLLAARFVAHVSGRNSL